MELNGEDLYRLQCRGPRCRGGCGAGTVGLGRGQLRGYLVGDLLRWGGGRLSCVGARPRVGSGAIRVASSSFNPACAMSGSVRSGARCVSECSWTLAARRRRIEAGQLWTFNRLSPLPVVRRANALRVDRLARRRHRRNAQDRRQMCLRADDSDRAGRHFRSGILRNGRQGFRLRRRNSLRRSIGATGRARGTAAATGTAAGITGALRWPLAAIIATAAGVIVQPAGPGRRSPAAPDHRRSADRQRARQVWRLPHRSPAMSTLATSAVCSPSADLARAPAMLLLECRPVVATSERSPPRRHPWVGARSRSHPRRPPRSPAAGGSRHRPHRSCRRNSRHRPPLRGLAGRRGARYGMRSTRVISLLHSRAHRPAPSFRGPSRPP